LLLAWSGWRQWGGRPALALVLAAAVPIGAWSLRNATQPLARSGGERVLVSLSHGSYPGMFFATEQYRYYPYREDPEQPAFGASWPRFRAVLAQRMAERPWRYLGWYLFEKPVWLWSWTILQGTGDAYVYPVRHSPFETQPALSCLRDLYRGLQLPFALLAAFGCLLAWWHAQLRPLAIPLAFSTALYSLLLPDPRYFVPLRPLQAVLAAGAVALLCQWLRARHAAAMAPAATAVPAQHDPVPSG
ncbi:MAG TPA: hypothetical protein VK348_11505, partial [Planctomycetota bacterium]|nr:hypothetical protein [Planctomycetota bacterium]